MTRFLESAPIVETREVAEKTFITRFRSPKIASEARAGQFVMLTFQRSVDPLLPRAFSFCDTDKETVSLLYVSVGRSTERLSHMTRGEEVILNGPLGRGFPDIQKGDELWVLVGGSGSAIVPIVLRSYARGGSGVRVFYGARKAGQIVDFGSGVASYSTDDGSRGFHGTVVELARKESRQGMPGVIFACGPTPMLKSVSDEFRGKVPTFLSVETPMACGNGLCQGCPVRKRDGSGYLLACKDGPVFEAREIELNREDTAR